MLYIGDTQVTDGGKLGGALSAYLGDLLVFPSAPTPTPTSGGYFYMKSLANNNTFSFIFSVNSAITATSISYSLNGGSTWTEIPKPSQTQTYQITGLTSGAVVYWKGVARNWGYDRRRSALVSSDNCEIGGNIMSLLYGDNFADKTEIEYPWAFFSFFNGSRIVSAENLSLPATTLTEACYYSMFNSCHNLVTPPSILPATTLAASCYTSMFENCHSLTVAPEMPATTLAVSCYNSMFSGCRSLEKAPELPVTTLVVRCYAGMFWGCSTLNYVKCLATTNINTTNCSSWLTSVSSTGTFVKASSATWGTGGSGIPSGWSVVNA